MSDQAERLEPQRAAVHLIPQNGNPSQTPLEVSRSLTLIGSGDACDWILESDRMDAAHAAIVCLNNTAYLCDLGARAGSSINGRRVRWARLADGDELEVGSVAFRVALMEPDGGAASETPAFRLTDGGTLGEVRNIDPALIIGRDPGCDAVLFDDSVAARHCLVVWTQSGPIIRNLAADQAVCVNGEPISERRLNSGDSISIRENELVFEIEGVPGKMRPESLRPERNQASSQRAATLQPAEEEPTVKNNHGKDDPRLGSGVSIPQRSVPERVRLAAGGAPSSGPDAKLNDKAAKLRARVAAAQKALDRRAQRHRDQIHRERASLEAYQTELQAKADDLLQAARESLDIRKSQEATEAASRTVPPDPEGERKRLDALGLIGGELRVTPHGSSAPGGAYSGLLIPPGSILEEDLPDIVDHTRAESAAVVNSSIRKASRWVLQDKARELADLVGSERDDIENAEGRFESLRLEIQRLRGFIARTEKKHATEASELEARLQRLKESERSLSEERGLLMSRIRQLDTQATTVRAQIEESGAYCEDLEREAEILTEAKDKLTEKEESLRTGLEIERQRLQVRQKELQRKVAELAKAAREKRFSIETEVSQRKAELDQREAELRANRAAVEETGRAEMERTAIELERMLSVRLEDIETEMANRQDDLDSRMSALSDTKPAPDFRVSPVSEAAGNTGPISGNRAGRLDVLRTEVEALRNAVAQLGKRGTVTEGFGTTHLGHHSGAKREGSRRTAKEIIALFDEQKRALRTGAD